MTRENSVDVSTDTALAFLKQYEWDVDRAYGAIKEDLVRYSLSPLCSLLTLVIALEEEPKSA